MVLLCGKQGYGLVWVDLVGGCFLVNEVDFDDVLEVELVWLELVELLVFDEENWFDFLCYCIGICCCVLWLFDVDSGCCQLLVFFKLYDLSGFGIDDKLCVIVVVGVLLGYVEEIQKQCLLYLIVIVIEMVSEVIVMNVVMCCYLELDMCVDGDICYMLLGVFDIMVMLMGGCLLWCWLYCLL